MRKIVLFLVLCAVTLPVRAADTVSPGAVPGGGNAPDARFLLDRVDDLFRGSSSHGLMTMKVTTVHWSRELRLEEWSQGKDKSLIRILAPKKEAGTTTLKSGGDIWNYLPKVKRVIKLPQSMMGDSWMGSHFTNDDLVRDSRMADDYSYSTTFKGEKDGETVTEITCVPRPDAAVVWGKVVLEIRDRDTMPLRIEYYDEDVKPARIMTFSDFRTFGTRLLPARCRIVPADRPREATEILYESMEFDPSVPANLFSLRSLQE